LLFIATTPVFLVGLLEDITKNIRPIWRFSCTVLSAVILVHSDKLQINSIHIPFFLAHINVWHLPATLAPIISIIFITGFVHSINIVDGLNGLAGMVSLMIFSSISYIAFQLNDFLVLGLCFAMLGAIFGFFIWNYPAGLIFMGDSGAYFLGFMLSATALLLITRNPSVSSWYPALLFVYPVFEMIFSIYRRIFKSKIAISQADSLHLHSLIYKKTIAWLLGVDTNSQYSVSQINSISSPFLWLLSSLAIIPATFFWKNSDVLFSFFILFCISYILLYRLVQKSFIK
jgi:UDP-GlcNAc:undecaprenyl-phosphate/decaprenyl-phosphate GlcNAc-1-phosphate transferase